jgi:4-hydroxy-tetrahydrodipicolinate synthase
MWHGYFTALLTPMREGNVDFSSLEKLVDWQIRQGIHGLVACGTTGESLTLTFAEQQQILETCVRVAAGRVPVLAGVGCVRTDETILLAKQAEAAGVDGLLVVAPAYIRPTEDGLFQHYSTIHHAIELPVILYNNPVRSAVNFSLDLLQRLRTLPRVVGLKDASDDLTRPTKIRNSMGHDLIKF